MTRNAFAFAFALAVCAALALSACNRSDSPADATAPAPDATASADATPAAPAPVAPADEAKPAATFNMADIAGTYAGDGTLELKADGTYLFTSGSTRDDGTWNADPSGPMNLRLDPNSKAVPDRVYTVADADTLQPATAPDAAAPGSVAFKRKRG